MAPAFRRLLLEAQQGKILTPYIRAALTNPNFTGFQIDVEGWTPRHYDGYFHPSTHSSWTPRQLFYYLTDPDAFVPETPTLLFVLAVTQGKFWHTFVQRLLLRKELLLQDEVPLNDLDYNRKGHTDGLLNTGEGFEFKTMGDRLIKKVKNAADLKEHHPTYYSQTQDYLDMAGLEAMRYLIMTLSSPFPMEEFVVPADPVFQAAQREKYRIALTASDIALVSETADPPDACCQPRSMQSRTCPARFACPLGTRT